MENFAKGTKLAILEDGEYIDEGIVQFFGLCMDLRCAILQIDSLTFDPGVTKEFGLIDDVEWALIFPDPMTDRRCYSSSGSRYTFQLVS